MQNKRKSYKQNRATGTKYKSPSISASSGCRGTPPSGRVGSSQQAPPKVSYKKSRADSFATRSPSGDGLANRGRAGVRHSEKAKPGKRKYQYGETASLRVGKKVRKKRRAAKVYLFLAVVTVVVSVILALTVFFKVDTIEVMGNFKYEPQLIIEQSGLKLGGNLLLMDKFSSIKSIKQNLIFIKDVEIRRSFPNKIIIKVTEDMVAAAFDAGGAYWLCDDMGRLLEISTAVPANAAIIKGAQLTGSTPGQPFQTSDKFKQQPLMELFAALRDNELFGLVSWIDISKIYDIKIGYLDRYEVKLGNSGDFDNSCKRLCMLIVQLEQEGHMQGKIDISDNEIHFVAEQ